MRTLKHPIQVPPPPDNRLADAVTTIMGRVMHLHNWLALKQKKRFRLADHMPYGVHPCLAALLVLHERAFAVERRLVYFEALAMHDIGEDTLADPDQLRATLVYPASYELIFNLTFGDNENTTEAAIKRGAEIAMLKSFDTFTNLMGLDLIPTEKWPAEKKMKRLDKAQQLFDFAQPHYPSLQIWCMARALLARSRELIK